MSRLIFPTQATNNDFKEDFYSQVCELKLVNRSWDRGQVTRSQSAIFSGEVTIVALGPLTNIALAMKLNRNFETNIKELVIMGGNKVDVISS